MKWYSDGSHGISNHPPPSRAEVALLARSLLIQPEKFFKTVGMYLGIAQMGRGV